MKKKELKILAKKIAKAEAIIQKNENQKSVAEAQQLITELAKSITSLEDIMILDELIQKKL